MQPYLLEIAKDRHPNGCHVLFVNISITCIERLQEIIRNEGIAFDYAKNGGTDFTLRQIMWNVDGFWRGMCRCYRKISDKAIIVEKRNLVRFRSVSIRLIKVNWKLYEDITRIYLNYFAKV